MHLRDAKTYFRHALLDSRKVFISTAWGLGFRVAVSTIDLANLVRERYGTTHHDHIDEKKKENLMRI